MQQQSAASRTANFLHQPCRLHSRASVAAAVRSGHLSQLCAPPSVRNYGIVGIAFLAAIISLLLVANHPLSLDGKNHAQAGVATPSSLTAKLHAIRSSPLDLELGGELAGLPAGAARYITRDDLLALPQVNQTVSDDPNLAGPRQVAGISLEELTKELAAAPESALVVAVCADRYRGNYPHAYVAAHHPFLVLKINGQPPERWPKEAEGHGSDMGPYMVSHTRFTPILKILSHADEPQIPWGVVRLEFRDAKVVFRAIAPRGPLAQEHSVQAGYRIAQQNCFRCHNMGPEGGQKAGCPWLVLSTWATASPEHFAAYVRAPKSKNPHAEMPGNPAYDDATLHALTAYFQTFSASEKP
jgi:mono/diheme cytochrome c family protein